MKPRLLVIDDSPEVRELIQHHLRGQNIEVLTASSGEEGLRVLDETDALISMVLLDLNMPEMDGFQFMDKIRHEGFKKRKFKPDKKKSHAANLRDARKQEARFRARLEKLKVVVVSARDHAEDVLKAKQYGVAAYLVKPFTKETLFARIKEAAGQKDTEQKPAPAKPGS